MCADLQHMNRVRTINLFMLKIRYWHTLLHRICIYWTCLPNILGEPAYPALHFWGCKGKECVDVYLFVVTGPKFGFNWSTCFPQQLI